MRLLVLVMLLFTGIAIQTCCKNDDLGYCSDRGVITGVDYRECACCGGWFIDIGDEELRAVSLPPAFVESFDLEDLPLPVFLEWSRVEDPCLGDEIEVECIRLR